MNGLIYLQPYLCEFELTFLLKVVRSKIMLKKKKIKEKRLKKNCYKQKKLIYKNESRPTH